MSNLSNLQSQKAALFAIDGNRGNLAQYKMPTGIVSASAMIPAPVQAILESQFKSVGLNFDITKLALNKDNRQALKDLKVTVDLITNNAKLLPQFAAELKKALKAARSMAEFNADVVKASLKEQVGIDQAQADILMAFAGYTTKRNRIEMKLEKRLEKMKQVHDARARHYNKTWGEQAQLIDAQWEVVTDIALGEMEVQKQKTEGRKQRKVANQQWQTDAI